MSHTDPRRARTPLYRPGEVLQARGGRQLSRDFGDSGGARARPRDFWPIDKVGVLCGTSVCLASLDVKWHEKAVFFGFEWIGAKVQKL